MLSTHHIRHHSKTIMKLLVGCCLTLALYALFSPAQASAHAISAPVAPTLEVDMGFDSAYKSGFWTPVHVNINNSNSADFIGTLSVSTYTELSRTSGTSQTSPWSFEQPVTLQKGAKKQITVYVPFYLGSNAIPQGVIARLRNTHGKVVATQTATGEVEVKPGNLIIGTLSDSGSDFSSLSTVFLPNQTGSLTLTSLNASNMPTMATTLENFDIIVLDNFTTSTLHPDQILALQTWVNRGGILIEIGGSQWQRTLGPLPTDLLPVAMDGTTVLPGGTHLLPLNSPIIEVPEEQYIADPMPDDVIMSTGTLRTSNSFSQNEAVLNFGPTPLIVQAHQGQGVISYLAIDPASPVLASWSGGNTLWSMVLLYALGDNFLISSAAQGYNTGPGQLLTRVGVLNMVAPDMLLGPSIILILLFGYALILGPIRLFAVKRLKKPQWWNWRIIVSLIVVFSLLSFQVALYQRSASITDNSVSIIQINQNGASAHATTYSGIFVPSAGDFNLHISGESAAQPISNQFLLNNTSAMSKKDMPASVVMGPKETNLKLQGLDAWTLHYAITEQDVQLHGDITAHLALQNNRLVGTIKNTLNTSFSDLYVLLAHSFVPIGHIGAGETQQINLPIFNVSPLSGKTLADQIAEQGGLSAPYFPYSSNGHPQNDFQRHMALLSALSGAGFTFPPCEGTCKTRAITAGDSIFVTGGRVPNPALSDYEPLTMPGAPATLIGWADQSLTNDVTINGWRPIGHQENFVQMPLNIDIASPLNIPPDFITGHVVDVQSYDAELTLPGIYTMTSGSITFELTLPNSDQVPVNGFTLTEPDLWAHPFGPGSGTAASASHIQAQLYNWYKGTWDTITLKPDTDTFTTMNTTAYLGPSGRLLLQISNQDVSLGKLYFGKPSLSLMG
ncbi:MAG: hypothetical protein JOZ18_10400 [Chloroflexi bacterium]|nr:hypothetical protein [Chloroflexota bacterium]